MAARVKHPTNLAVWLQEAQKVLRITDYRIEVQSQPSPRDALAEVEVTGQDVRLWLCRDFTKFSPQRQTKILLHELCHVVMVDFGYTENLPLDPTLRGFLDTLEESLCDRFAGILADHVSEVS